MLEHIRLTCRSSLVKEATIHARQRGERSMSARSVRKVREVCDEVCSSAATDAESDELEQIQRLNMVLGLDITSSHTITRTA